jgi:exo-beta-1,3-glucanase (GH17 family)/cellulose synthase/poly-beta-1,6-N-acetylglucosamine synthase-like glycosyltransferase
MEELYCIFMKHKKLIVNILVGTAFAALTFTFWALTNQPSTEPPWPSSVAGMSFSPLRQGDNPAEGLYPTLEEIEQDIILLTGKVHSIRTYGVGGTLGNIPALASKHGLTVTLGAWLTADDEGNRAELQKLIEVAKSNSKTVKRLIIGNETVLRGELSPEELAKYLDWTRKEVKKLKIPVSTGEPWNVWVTNPELALHADFIAAHFLPYWEGIGLNEAVGHIDATVQQLQAAFPKLPVVLAEVGWPSNGRTLRSANASESHEAIFLRRFLARAEKAKYDYYLMEAFDQPWKTDSEGSVGAYWGVYDVFRNQKFAFTEPIVRVPHWRLLAGTSMVVAILVFGMLLLDSNTLMGRGKGFLAATSHGLGISVVWAGYEYANQYLTPMTIIIGIFLAIGYLGICLVLLAEAHEWVETSWVSRRRRLFTPATKDKDVTNYLPKVSIHVPAYNEPPDMMKSTLDSLARLDYPDFEVLVIDNNTKDPQIWQPVESHCRALGERFRFFHVDPLKGFKAGALNFAMENMAADSEIIAVIDSDYQVKSSWLRDLAPYFAKPEIGFVQAPQDYRDASETAFKSMCYAEYQGFFHIGMVTRNDRNAIIEHGTMTMVRASILHEVGGWAEWCITEDAELGLRIFEHGYEGAYVEESYGKGLMPDTFVDYKKQRYRWAYGAIQILKRHRHALFGSSTGGLSLGQRYHFLAGWLPWIADSINLFYTVGAILWSILMIADPKHVDPPLTLFMIPPIVLFCFKVAKLVHLYRSRMRSTRRQTASAALAGIALSHTISKAVLAGFLTSGKPFFRTPKCKNSPALVQAFAASLEETCLTLLLWLAAAGVILGPGKDLPGAIFWSGILFIQSLPYVASMIMSLTNAVPMSRTRAASSPAVPAPAHTR